MLPHPWFNPLYRRLLTTVFCAVWLAIELWKAPSSIWTILAAGFTAWTVF